MKNMLFLKQAYGDQWIQNEGDTKSDGASIKPIPVVDASFFTSLENRNSDISALFELIDISVEGISQEIFNNEASRIFNAFEQDAGRDTALEALRRHSARLLSFAQSPGALDAIATLISKNLGDDVLRSCLESDGFEIYHDACPGNIGIMKKLVQIAKKLGGPDLIDEMISAQNYYGLREAVDEDDRIGALLIINALTDQKRNEALGHVPSDWALFHEGRKIRIDEVWQDMGGDDERWMAVTNKSAPHPSLAEQSPYKFSFKIYNQILPDIRTACRLENAEEQAETIAFKMAVLFSSTQEIDRFLKDYNDKFKDKDIPFSIRKAMDFQLPARGLWNVEHWRKVIMQYGTRAVELLKDAPEIERHVRKKGQELPTTLNGLKAVVTQIEYDATNIVADFTAAAQANGIDTENYKQALDFINQNGQDIDQLPDIFIDGADIGYPNYYFTKIAPRDPLQCWLGDINNHSQSLTNPAGQYTMPHIVGSQFAASYVLKKKTGGKITDQDKIVSDSWAYISEQNNIVFDGIGGKDSSTCSSGPIGSSDERFRIFLEQFAFDVVDKHKFTATSANIRKGAETTSPDKIRRDAAELYVEGVRLGDDKDWVEKLGRRHRQISKDDFGQIFNPQDKKPGWLHNESQDHQLLIPPKSHREGDKLSEINQKPADYEALLEQEAKAYITRTVEKLAQVYGITVRVGLELEMHAYDLNGKRNSNTLDKDQVIRSLRDAGLDAEFEDENDDGDGQYEAKTSPRDPLASADMATAMRDHLVTHARSFNLSRIAFDTVLDGDSKNEAPTEPSSTHINVSLWTRDGKPLTGLENEGAEALTNAVVKGMTDAQRKLSVLFAQSAQDFKRFGYMSPKKERDDPNRFFAPTHIFAVRSHRRVQEGPTIGVWGSEDTARIENRMTGSSSNYYVAMAGTLAGIEWALDNYTWRLGPDADPSAFPAENYVFADTGNIRLAIHKEFTLPEKTYTGWSGMGYSHRKKTYTGPHPQDIYTIPESYAEALRNLGNPGNHGFARQRLGENFFKVLTACTQAETAQKPSEEASITPVKNHKQLTMA
jgi:hypothetical protein